MFYSLVLAVLLSTPLGPALFKQEIRVENQEKCEILKEYIVKNTEITTDYPVIGASASCEKKIET